MPTLTERTITDKETLINQLKIVRENGFAVDDMENEEGVCCMAAPVKDYEGKIVAAISISGPAARVTILHRSESARCRLRWALYGAPGMGAIFRGSNGTGNLRYNICLSARLQINT